MSVANDSLPTHRRDGWHKGRGATLNPNNRYQPTAIQPVDDGWWREQDPETIVTVLTPEKARSIITRNQSPDIPFDRSINTYRGCEHGCVYCYARPTHAYIDLSQGLDFETKISFKHNAAELLRQELAKPGYHVKPIALGTNTDPYQPIEAQLSLTRAVLEVLLEAGHPLTITTKGGLIERDLDLLAALSVRNLVAVTVSVTTLSNSLKRILEPRTAAPSRRLQVISLLRKAGIPVGVSVAPMIPFINDDEMEKILAAAATAGALSANYILLRLPLEVAPLFRHWLETHFPERAKRVMSAVQAMRGGRDYQSDFGTRMRGEGLFAELLERRFLSALAKYKLRARERVALDTHHFRAPRIDDQLPLF